jgi:Txe/YoeB family toxin of Txe-Axe toxin-antitoxin module
LSIREEQKWLDRINKLVIKIDKKHPRKIEKLVKKLAKDKFKSSPLNDAQKTEVLEKFDEMLDDFESEN